MLTSTAISHRFPVFSICTAGPFVLASYSVRFLTLVLRSPPKSQTLADSGIPTAYFIPHSPAQFTFDTSGARDR